MRAHILVIDDEPRWIEFARDDLGTTFEVDVATNLKTALAQLARAENSNRPYALIIASSRRADVLKAINKKYPGKIVVATGQPTTREAIDMYRLGAQDYFAKDLRRDIVSERLSEAIDKSAKTSVK